jgi:hypothetical protein
MGTADCKQFDWSVQFACTHSGRGPFGKHWGTAAQHAIVLLYLCNLFDGRGVGRKRERKAIGKEECRLLGYKNPVRTSQETHYVSVTESSKLMLCKIWGFHSGDNEECRLLGYKNPVRTSQETHYVFATESSQLMLCKIWGFHSGDNEEWRLLGCYALWLL